MCPPVRSVSESSQLETELLDPLYGLQAVGGRNILAADVPLVPEFVHFSKQERVVDLSRAGLMPSGVVCNLDVVDLGQMLSQDLGEVPLCPLRVVHIVLH